MNLLLDTSLTMSSQIYQEEEDYPYEEGSQYVDGVKHGFPRFYSVSEDGEEGL